MASDIGSYWVMENISSNKIVPEQTGKVSPTYCDKSIEAREQESTNSMLNNTGSKHSIGFYWTCTTQGSSNFDPVMLQCYVCDNTIYTKEAREQENNSMANKIENNHSMASLIGSY